MLEYTSTSATFSFVDYIMLPCTACLGTFDYVSTIDWSTISSHVNKTTCDSDPCDTYCSPTCMFVHMDFFLAHVIFQLVFH